MRGQRCETETEPGSSNPKYQPCWMIWIDGRNPAPVDMVNIPWFTGLYTSQVVQAFVHQQYGSNWQRKKGTQIHDLPLTWNFTSLHPTPSILNCRTCCMQLYWLMKCTSDRIIMIQYLLPIAYKLYNYAHILDMTITYNHTMITIFTVYAKSCKSSLTIILGTILPSLELLQSKSLTRGGASKDNLHQS